MEKKGREEECRKAKGPGYFASIWLTDGCNLKCKYCFQDRSKPMIHMSDETLKQTIRFINAMPNISGVSFFGAESLMRPQQFKRALSMLKVPKFFMTTNGTLLNDEILDWIAEYKVHVNLSLDGMKETQDFWRDGTYDKIIEHLPRLLDHQKKVGLQILLLCVNESQLYQNVKHIRDLGFNSVYINQIDPYGTKVRNEPEKVMIFKEQYRKVVTELHDPRSFHVSDFERWREMLTKEGFKTGKCGFHNFGLGISPSGKLFPCHRGPQLPDELSFGDVWTGIDHEKMKQVRGMAPMPKTCGSCALHFTQCPIDCYTIHNRFGMDPHPWHCLYEQTKVDVIREIIGLEPVFSKLITPNHFHDARLIVATLIDPHKYYIVPQFLKNLVKMNFPLVTDYYFVLDKEDYKTYRLIDNWIDGKYDSFAPYPRDLFRYVRTLLIPTYSEDTVMDRISRGRDTFLRHVFLRGNYTHLMWLDSDIIAPMDTVPKLLAVNEAISGALITTRNEFTRNTWYNTYMDKSAEGGGYPSKTDFVPGDIINVDATGCDCIILRRDVLEAIGKYEHRNRDHPDGPAGEDMLFCQKAKKLGFKTKINTGIAPRHLGISDIELTLPVPLTSEVSCQSGCQAGEE